MRNYKYMMAQFTFYDRTGICRLLEQQAQKGWQLDKITNFAWRFRRMEPKKLHYAVTYFPKASAYDPYPSEAQRELHDFCAHSGWILAGTTAQMQIFYNESEKPIPIETDPMMELENIHKSAKKNYLPAYVMLLILAIFQISTQISQLMTFPLTYLSQDTVVFNWLCEIVLFTMCATEIGGYLRWYRRAKKAAENGAFVETRGFRSLQVFLLGVILVALVWLLCSMRPQMAMSMTIILAMLFAVILAVMGIQNLMKWMGVSTGTNRTVTLVLAVLFSLAVGGLAVPVGIMVMDHPVWEENREVRKFEWNGHYFDIYNDDIPLRVEDLIDAESPDYSYEAREQESPMLKRGEYSQRIWAWTDLPEMSYIVYTVKLPWLYDLVVQQAIKPVDYAMGVYENGEPYYDNYVQQEAIPWGADVVWRRYAGGEAYDHWVLCYKDCMVIFQPNWEPTQEQMAKIGEVFGKRYEQNFVNLKNS